MQTASGKRKRSTGVSSKVARQKVEEPTFDQDAQEIFRRHFEAQFNPLPESRKLPEVADTVYDESAEESEWSGIPDEEDDVQVVKHSETSIETMSKEQLKSFMVRIFFIP